MTDTLSAPPIDPGPPPPAPPGYPSASERFFLWVRGLGIVRADAWLGGVCGGVAARLRVDPLIIRGIVLVAAVVGFPAMILYAVAWALLPDITGRIHLRELFRGRFDPAMVGIALLVLATLIPVVPWLWGALFWPLWATVGGSGYPPVFVSDPWASPFGVFGIVIGLVATGGLLFLIVRSARADRLAGGASRQASATDAPVPPAASSSGDDAASPEQGDVDSAGDASAESTDGIRDASTAASTSSMDVPTDADIADWRATRDQWRAQHEEWRKSRHDHDRSAREQARREREAMGVAWAAEAEERRRVRRLTKPRTSFVFVITVLGAALVAGAVGALAALGSAEASDYAGAIGTFAAAVVVGVAMFVAGAVRRRSGFLTAVAIVLLVSGFLAAFFGGPRDVALAHAVLTTSKSPQAVSQLFGSTDIYLERLSATRTVQAGTIDVQKAGGTTFITVNPGTELVLDARLGDGGVTYTRVAERTGEYLGDGMVYPSTGADGVSEFDWSVRNTATVGDYATVQRVVLTQTGGSVYVTILEPEEER